VQTVCEHLDMLGTNGTVLIELSAGLASVPSAHSKSHFVLFVHLPDGCLESLTGAVDAVFGRFASGCNRRYRTTWGSLREEIATNLNGAPHRLVGSVHTITLTSNNLSLKSQICILNKDCPLAGALLWPGGSRSQGPVVSGTWGRTGRILLTPDLEIFCIRIHFAEADLPLSVLR